MNHTPSLPSNSTIGKAALRVNDKEKVKEFYTTVIGLDLIQETNKEAIIGTQDKTILKLIEDQTAPRRQTNETGLYHLAFLIPTKEALGDALNRIETKSTLEGAADHLVSEALYLSDPEDNGVEVYWDKPTDEWPREPDGSIGIDTKPLDLSGILGAANGALKAPDETTLGHVHLEVSSIRKARDFYVDALGMQVKKRLGASSLFISSGDYHHHIGLNVWGHRSASPVGRGLEWFEVEVPSLDDLDSIYMRMDDVDAVHMDRRGDGFISLEDFDGIKLRVTAAR